MFSFPLSVRFPCPGVTRRTALRRSDFPPASAVGPGAASCEVCLAATRANAGGRLAGCDLFIITYRSRFLDRYTAPYEDLVPVACLHVEPYSGPRRAERAKRCWPTRRGALAGISTGRAPCLVCARRGGSAVAW